MSTEALYRTGALVRYNAVLRLRDPSQLISYLLTPMIFMVLFAPLYEKALGYGAAEAVTGQLIMFSFFATAIVGHSIFIEREWQTWDRLRASRAARVELLIGKAVPVFVVLLFQQTVLLVYGCLVVRMPFPRSVPLVVLAMVVWGFTMLALGSALAIVVRSRGDLIVATDVGAIVVSSIGGSMLPTSLMPGWARAVSPYSPGYWGLSMFRHAIAGDAGPTVSAALVCLAFGLAGGTVAVYRLAHGWGRSALV
jgi:ABC-2 type transport system permease protein